MDPSPPPSPEFLLNAFCTRCGYDLRSNNVVGPCPKCGTELAYATFISGLANANPLWLYRIYLGISGLILAQFILVVERASQLLVWIGRIDSPGFLSNWWTRVDELSFGIQWFCGLFLLATKEDRDEKEPWSSPRKLLLWIGGAMVVMHVLRPLLFYFLPYPRQASSQFLFHFMWVLQIGAVIVLFLYILRLGQRAGDPVLKRHLPLLVTMVIVNGAMYVIFSLRDSPLARSDSLTLGALVQTAVAAYAVWVLLKMRSSIGTVIFMSKSEHDSTSVLR